MSELQPLPLSTLLRRASTQYDQEQAVFDLPADKFYRGYRGLDFSVTFHGDRASTVAGPAAGPHTQLAQNIALAYLAGGRILELKTVQVNDRLTLTRPCIDMATVGYNVEWSQELPVHQSAHEYAKARYLVEALKMMGIPDDLPADGGDVLFDTSVGYNLEGIRSAKVNRFLRTMLDASAEMAEIRSDLQRHLPREMQYLAGIDVPDRISDCITLSTFHGCPPDEIEAICTHLMEEHRFHVIVKMNPTLMGFEEVRDLIRGTLGYDEIEIPRSAFEHDPDFNEGVDLVKRLREVGERSGRMVGAKFTNTLFVKNHKSYFPGEESMYLSGQPLHVLSLNLAARFRDAVGPDMTLSFSAGIDAKNFAGAVAAGLTPVTACTDLLRPGGYGRMHAYHAALATEMKLLQARNVAEFILRSAGVDADPSDEEAVRKASLINHKIVAESSLTDERYRSSNNRKAPRKTGSHLELFDCINCDKCIPVCPNDANFSWILDPHVIHYHDLVVQNGNVVPLEQEIILEVGKGKRPDRQIANFADFCNDCGNCDIFCPESGGPQVKKPRIFSSRTSFDADSGNGFYFERQGSALRVLARFDSRVVEYVGHETNHQYYDGGVELQFAGGNGDPEEARLIGNPDEGYRVSISQYHAIRLLAGRFSAPGESSYLAAMLDRESI